MAINIPNILAKITETNGKPTQVFYRFLSLIASYINSNPVTLEYNGSPEGNLEARYKDQCWDYTNNKLYFKSTTTGNTGWVVIN